MSSMRLDRAQRIMTREEINGVLLFDPYNIRYLTGYTPTCAIGASVAVLGSEEEPCLIVPQVEFELAKTQSWFRNIQPYSISIEKEYQSALFDQIRKAIEGLNLASVVFGIELNYVSAKRFETLKRLFPDAGFKDVSFAMAELRMIKDEVETEKISLATQIAENGVRTAIEFIQPGITEIEVAAEVERTLRKAGATQTGYPTVIASGPRAGCPYAPASRRKIGKNEYVVIAVAAMNDDYCSDLIRTVLSGKPTEKQLRLFKAAKDSLNAAKNQLSSGIHVSEIASTIHKVADNYGFSTNLFNQMGNSIGLQPIEPPIFTTSNETPILPGMVFSIKTGFYDSDFGGVQVADTLHHQKNGNFTLLNQIPLETV